ncbi:MAG: hypothetical protein ACLFTE_07100 [Salinivenus sp.]
MTYSRLSAALGGALFFVLLVSCSDPSGVGIGVGDDPLEGGDPVVETVLPETLRTDTSPRTTGLEGAQQTWRFLAGAVDDYGQVRADGYLDVQAPSEIPSEIALSDPDSLDVTLRLETGYVHGDTSSQVDFQLHDLEAEADMSEAPADTTFDVVDPEIDSYAQSPTDSLMTFSLPDAWVQDNVEQLQDTTKVEDLTGFRLSAPNANAVVGFEHATARLRVSRGDESVDFLVQKSFSNIRRPAPSSPPSDRTLLQDGLADDLVIEWDPAQLDSLRDTPLNRAGIIIPTDPDTASLDDSFVRPTPDYRVVATRADGAPTCQELSTFEVSEDGDECGLPLPTEETGDDIRIDERTAFAIFETLLVPDSGNAPSEIFTDYRIEVVDRPGSPNNARETVQGGLPSTLPTLVPTPGPDSTEAPRLELTVTPL